MNLFLSILFLAVILMATIIAVKVKKVWIRLLCIGLAVALVVIMAIVFKSWLFVIWGFLISGLIYLILKIGKLFWRLLLGLVLIVSLVLGVMVISNAIHTANPATTKTEALIAPIPAVEPKAEVPVVAPTVCPVVDSVVAPVVAPPVPAPSSCIEAVSVASQVHGGKVELDLNDGDSFDYSLTIVNPDVPQGKETLVVLTEPGHIFDVVHPVMYFTSFRLQGTMEQALCSATKLGGNAQTFVFVGEAPTPQGWTTVAAKGWWAELVAKQYSEQALTPGGAWTAIQIAVDDQNRTIKSENLIYGQLWNPKESGKVVHFQIENGYKLVIPDGWQGTYWTVSGADSVIVQYRLVQASKEVVERDELSLGNVTLLFCGANLPTAELKVGTDSLKWIQNLEGWTCEIIK